MSTKEEYWQSRSWAQDNDAESKRILFMAGWDAALEQVEGQKPPTNTCSKCAPQMPPMCGLCPVKKPCELDYDSDRCITRLRRHFLLA
jgi:hypothetical protein